jgi:hypothetical protein
LLRERKAPPSNKRWQRTGINVPLIDNLPHDAVVFRPLKLGVRCFEVPKAVIDANSCSEKVSPIGESELRRLLDALCIEWGFCIPPRASDEIARRATIRAEEFAKAVLEAEEMNPEYEQKWFRRITDRFIEEFEK